MGLPTRAASLFLGVFFQIFFLTNFNLPVANAFPGKGSDDLDFNPAGDSEGAHCLNLFGVDLNALFDVSEPFVNRNCREVKSGGFYIANNHIILNEEYSEDLRQQLEAMDYRFLGSNPMEDLFEKFASIRFEVRNGLTGKIREYEFSPSEIANHWDYIHDDPLVCSDFFTFACEGPLLGVPGTSPMVAFLPKLPPLPPGSYSIDMYYTFSEAYNAGFGIASNSPYNFEAGETLVFANFFEVVKRAAQSISKTGR